MSCAEAGVLGVLPGVVGSLQATEVIKVLTGIGRVISDGVLMYDALGASMSTLPVQRDVGCSTCGKDAAEQLPRFGIDRLGPDVSVPEITASDVSCADLVVDVREDDEVQRRPWSGALLRPWSSWDGDTTQELVSAAASGPGGVVVVCASGMRSSAAVKALLAAGAQPQRVASLRGGLAAVDRELNRQKSL